MIRILHVVGRMNRGGVETWLMHVLRNIDRSEFRMDFLVHSTEPGAYDEEVRALGGNILPCLRHGRPWKYAPNFIRILRDHGPYDVVHSHVHHYSGYVLRLAHRFGVRHRIAHSHNDTAVVDAPAQPLRRAYFWTMRRWIDAHATAGLACSEAAGRSLFGSSWGVDRRLKTLSNSVDLAPFRARPNPVAVRAELGIPGDAFVIGHVARFSEQKNHSFLIDVAAEVIKREPKTRLLLVGDGPLKPAIEAKARHLGLEAHVIFAGVRADVPRLMIGAMDAFVFPSLYEGLGLVMIEAQAAGVRCLCSDVVPKEADVVPGLVRRLPLSAPPSKWADDLLAFRSSTERIDPAVALSAVAQSAFNIEVGIKELERVYRI